MSGMVIPEVAVEAAIKAVVDAMIEYGPDGHTDGAEEITHAALEAAAPRLMASAWDEGHDAGFTFGAFQGRVKETRNPYRTARG